MTRIILVRHGETDWNVERRIQGSTDIPLNGNGEAQAQRLAQRLASISIGAFYTSDYIRAERTARTVRELHPDTPFFIRHELRERNWGELEGLKWEEIQRDHPDVVAGVTSGSPDFAPPGGESKTLVLERAVGLVEEIAAQRPDETVLVMTHGGVAVIILKHALGIDIGALTPFRVENCALHILDTDGAKWYVHTLNDMSHLDGFSLSGSAPPGSPFAKK
jgi:broad specificity phosphatase PhoE